MSLIPIKDYSISDLPLEVQNRMRNEITVILPFKVLKDVDIETPWRSNTELKGGEVEYLPFNREVFDLIARGKIILDIERFRLDFAWKSFCKGEIEGVH